MNRTEHLLTILTEECAEVQKATTKAIRFGGDEGRDIQQTNRDRMQYELNDLLAVVEMLNAEGWKLYPNPTLRKAKKDKVEEYLSYSRECGTLSG